MKGSLEFEVDFYFSEKILKRLGLSESETTLKASPKNILHFLKHANYDLVIIGTVHRNFNVFKEIVERYNTSVIVHNMNFAKLSRFQLFKNTFKKDFPYRVKLLLKEGLPDMPEIYKKAKNQLVLDQNLAHNNEKYLPVFYREFSERNQNERLTVVIPGTVSQERRDYKMVLDKLSSLSKDRFQIIVLGQARGEELAWLQNFEKENGNVQIKYFIDKVSQLEFDFWMNKADLLWCPIQKETEFFSNQEIYGETKMTGNIGDAIKYSKFAIFPKDYAHRYPFIFPQDSVIEQQFMALKNYGGYNFEDQFSREKISSELHGLLRSIV